MSDDSPQLPNDPEAEVGLRYLGEPGPGESAEYIGESVEPARYESEDADSEPDAVNGEVDQPPIYRHDEPVAEGAPSLTTGLDPVQAQQMGMDPDAVDQAE